MKENYNFKNSIKNPYFAKLTKDQIAELEALKKYPVDFSDIPEIKDLSRAKFKNIK